MNASATTQIYDLHEKEPVSYVLNFGFSPNGQREIVQIQSALEQDFPGVIWSSPPRALHITLMDWLAPFVDYGPSNDDVFEKIFLDYDAVLVDLIKTIDTPLVVNFNEIAVSPVAVIIKGDDNGQLQVIRDSFLDKIKLLPGTKPPPRIVHSTICRYLKRVALENIRQSISLMSLSFTEKLDKIRLVRETKIPMLEFKVLKEYKIGL